MVECCDGVGAQLEGVRGARGHVGASPHEPDVPVSTEAPFGRAERRLRFSVETGPEREVGRPGVGVLVALQHEKDVADHLRRLRQERAEVRDLVGADLSQSAGGKRPGRRVERDHHRLDVRRGGVVVVVGDVQDRRRVALPERGAGRLVDIRLAVGGHRRARPVRREVRGDVHDELGGQVLARVRQVVQLGRGRVPGSAETEPDPPLGDRPTRRRDDVLRAELDEARPERDDRLGDVGGDLGEVRDSRIGHRRQHRKGELDGLLSGCHRLSPFASGISGTIIGYSRCRKVSTVCIISKCRCSRCLSYLITAKSDKPAQCSFHVCRPRRGR